MRRKESRIVLESVLEPIVFRFEPNESFPRRLAMTRNDNFLAFRLAQVTRQVVLDFGERHSRSLMQLVKVRMSMTPSLSSR